MSIFICEKPDTGIETYKSLRCDKWTVTVNRSHGWIRVRYSTIGSTRTAQVQRDYVTTFKKGNFPTSRGIPKYIIDFVGEILEGANENVV